MLGYTHHIIINNQFCFKHFTCLFIFTHKHTLQSATAKKSKSTRVTALVSSVWVMFVSSAASTVLGKNGRHFLGSKIFLRKKNRSDHLSLTIKDGQCLCFSWNGKTITPHRSQEGEAWWDSETYYQGRRRRRKRCSFSWDGVQRLARVQGLVHSLEVLVSLSKHCRSLGSREVEEARHKLENLWGKLKAALVTLAQWSVPVG